MPRPGRFDDIVDAAALLFGKKGYHACSLEDIAAEVGIWKGSIYHYIDTKEDLLLAVVSGPAERLLSALRETAGSELAPADKIRGLVANHVAVLHENFEYSTVYLQEIAGRHRSQEWAAMDREYVRLIEQIVAEGIEDGVFAPSVDPRIATFTLVGSLNWLVRWYRPAGEMDPDQIAEHIADLALGGLRGVGGG